MRIDLASAGRHQDFSFDRRFQVETTDGKECSCRAKVLATVVKTDEKIILEVKVDSGVEVMCSRCLDIFTMPVQLSYALMLRHAGEGGAGTEGEEKILKEGEENDYDVLPRVREEIVLALPIKLLCSEDCEGLCPRCGINLNRDSCDCEREEGDPRWAPLRKLLKKEERKKAQGE